jgi:hypothetical protein
VIGLDLFDSLLWDHRAWAKKRELALEDGVFQDFTIECEEIRFHSSRAVLKTSASAPRTSMPPWSTPTWTR